MKNEKQYQLGYDSDFGNIEWRWRYDDTEPWRVETDPSTITLLNRMVNNTIKASVGDV